MSIKNRMTHFIMISAIAMSGTSIPLAHAESITPKHTSEGTVVYNEEFKNLDTDKWKVYNYGQESGYKEYKGFNTTIENGNLVMSSQRHCLDDGEVPGKENISVKPCDEGKTTQYTSGRVENKTTLDGNKSYRIDIRAKVEWNGLKDATQPALWVRNNNVSYCAKPENTWGPLGEMDLFESWGDPTRMHSGIFLGCRYGTNFNNEDKGLFEVKQAQVFQPGVLDNWHTWTLVYDKQNQTFEYLFDEKPVPIYNFWDTKNKKPSNNRENTGSLIKINEDYTLTEDQKKQILDQMYTIILNDHVHPNKIDDTKDFKQQRLLVDSVVIRQYDQSPYLMSNPNVPSSTTKPSSAPSKPSSTTKPSATTSAIDIEDIPTETYNSDVAPTPSSLLTTSTTENNEEENSQILNNNSTSIEGKDNESHISHEKNSTSTQNSSKNNISNDNMTSSKETINNNREKVQTSLTKETPYSSQEALPTIRNNATQEPQTSRTGSSQIRDEKSEIQDVDDKILSQTQEGNPYVSPVVVSEVAPNITAESINIPQKNGDNHNVVSVGYGHKVGPAVHTGGTIRKSFWSNVVERISSIL